MSNTRKLRRGLNHPLAKLTNTKAKRILAMNALLNSDGTIKKPGTINADALINSNYPMIAGPVPPPETIKIEEIETPVVEIKTPEVL